jgi:hypothetical protein
MDDSLASLVDQTRIVAIDATVVPAPPQAALPGEYLFVNCHYNVSLANAPRTDLFDSARSDSLEICRRLAADQCIDRCVAAVVTIYGHFPVDGAARPARRRIYRVTVRSQDLRSNRLNSSTFLSDSHAEESSELVEIVDLIHQATH